MLVPYEIYAALKQSHERSRGSRHRGAIKAHQSTHIKDRD